MSDNQNTKSLIQRMASRFGVDAAKFYETLKATAFKQRDGSAPTNEQMFALLVVADQYGLNPFTREIYAFPDKNNGIIPVVGVDGWSRIINTNSQYDGVEFVYSDEKILMPGAKVECPTWIETWIYRKDRTRPTKIREYLDETYRPPYEGKGQHAPYKIDGPWQSHPKRQLRHKSLIQCARVALGFVGIYDQDEAERIVDMGAAVVVNQASEVSTQGNSAASVPASAPLQIDHKKMEPFLQRIVGRAMADGSWGTAREYVENRFDGAELEYAIQYLRDAELDAMDPPVTPNGGHVSQDGGNTTFVDDTGAQSAGDYFPSTEPEESDFFAADEEFADVS